MPEVTVNEYDDALRSEHEVRSSADIVGIAATPEASALEREGEEPFGFGVGGTDGGHDPRDERAITTKGWPRTSSSPIHWWLGAG